MAIPKPRQNLKRPSSTIRRTLKNTGTKVKTLTSTPGRRRVDVIVGKCGKKKPACKCRNKLNYKV